VTRVAVISANLGNYDSPSIWPVLDPPDAGTVTVNRFTDATFPPRPLAMTSRLQAGIPKWFGWQLVPDADVYLWIDASCAPAPHAVEWFLDHLGQKDIAVFRHPERKTIREEYEFMKARMARPGETYLNARYKGEDLDGQYRAIAADWTYCDDVLYASTAFAYRPTMAIRKAFERIWAAKARYLLHDQLMFPYALRTHNCAVSIIEQNYLKCEALTFVRTGQRRSA